MSNASEHTTALREPRPARRYASPGDLHHHNILRDGERWLVIDSEAMRCEPEFDVAPLMWNPIGSIPSDATIQACFDVVAEAESTARGR
jgi:streptomycin 6-kinase